MIERYSRKVAKKIWEDQNKYEIWLDIELAATQAMEKINAIPKVQIRFKSKVEIIVKTDSIIKDKILNDFEQFDMPLQIHIDGKKSVIKKIYKINFKKISAKLLKINIYADGGIPIKSFIQSSTVTPNLTDLLKNRCECVQFDFKKIDVMS